MVVEECEMQFQGEVESGVEEEANKLNHPSPFLSSSLGRQTSIYSLTLDEFQQSVCESGKNFGSMNMDEFLTSIWSAEEINNNNNNNLPLSMPTPTTLLRKQSSLPRQPSMSLPPPLCSKTVDEVWSHIHKQQHNNNIQNTAPRQPTFSEMTLEDFLVKAGVVRETCAPLPAASHSFQHYSNNNAPSFGGGGYHAAPGICFGGSGYGLGMSGPVSSGNSSDGIGNEKMRSRKRMVDGPVEKVVERRQRRMIKNRESAARSRARKQAYTVELEAELNQLREENAQLKQALAELESRRKQQCFEEVNVSFQTKAQKAKEKLRALKRNMSY
ncbi:Protein ABSCISIC ACID-INSENSITIVE 5, partial [Mucuna pruriens]